jgi:hypothetical protein
MQLRGISYSETPKEMYHLEDVDIDENIILKEMLGRYGADWIQVAQDRAYWRAMMDMLLLRGI